jgi:hypothetical protein
MYVWLGLDSFESLELLLLLLMMTIRNLSCEELIVNFFLDRRSL